MIGIPCQVYALRPLEAELGLEALYVIGMIPAHVWKIAEPLGLTPRDSERRQ